MPISPRVRGQIVVNDQHVTPLLHEVLAHRRRSIGCDELHARRGVIGTHNNDGMFHRPVVSQAGNHARDIRAALADAAVDANDIGPRWLMMVSIAIDVLPVWRSPNTS